MNLDKLIEKTTPVAEPIKFDLGFGDDCVLWFKLPQTYTEWNAFKRERASWARQHSTLKAAPDPSWQEFWTQDVEALETVFMLTRLSHEPSKLKHLDALKMLRSPALIEAVNNHLNMHLCQGIVQAFEEKVSEAKNDLSGTPDTDSGLASADKSTGSTPTN